MPPHLLAPACCPFTLPPLSPPLPCSWRTWTPSSPAWAGSWRVQPRTWSAARCACAAAACWPALHRRQLHGLMQPVRVQLPCVPFPCIVLQVALRLADLFRLRLDIGGRVEASAAVEVLPGAQGGGAGVPSRVGIAARQARRWSCCCRAALTACKSMPRAGSPRPWLSPPLTSPQNPACRGGVQGAG